jgi:hypothetical protein
MKEQTKPEWTSVERAAARRLKRVSTDGRTRDAANNLFLMIDVICMSFPCGCKTDKFYHSYPAKIKDWLSGSCRDLGIYGGS